jgi:hypothetical protein
MDGSLHGAVRYLGLLSILMITRIHARRKFMKDVFKTGKGVKSSLGYINRRIS